MQDTPAIIKNWLFMFSDQRLVEVRPPVDALFVFGYLLWEDDPLGYHVMQIILHSLATMVLLFTFKVLGVDTETALFSSTLFLINVVHFQAIHQITCITYTLSFIFSLLCICSHAYLLRSKLNMWRIISLLALICALFSHPASVFIVIFCFYITYRINGLTWKSINVVVPLVVTAFLSGTAAFLLSLHGDQVQGVLNTPDLMQIILQPFWYWGRLFTSLHWISPALLQDRPETWELIIGFLALGCFGLFYYLRISPVDDWAVWVFLSVLPFVNYPNEMLGHGPSRHLYFASAGASLLFAWSILTFIRKWFKNHCRFAFVIAIGLIFSTSIDGLKRVEAHSYYRSGRGYVAENNLQLGETQYSKAISIDMGLLPMDIFERLAIVRFALGLPIRNTILNALEVYPQSDLLYIILGISYEQNPDSSRPNAQHEYIQRAFTLTQDESKLRSQHIKLLQSLGAFYYSAEQYEKAISLYRQSLQIYPGYVFGIANLGKLYQTIGRDSEAISLYTQLAQVNPEIAASVLTISAYVFYQDGKIEQAIQMYRMLTELKPNDGNAFYHLGLALKSKHDYSDAKMALEKAIRFATENDDVH